MALKLKPSEIYYSQNSISNSFKDTGKHIGETLDDLCERRVSIDDIPRIHVANIKGRWVSSDNRRLWVFRQLESLGKCERIPVIRINRIYPSKQTSTSGGNDVHVRGNAGGHYADQFASSIFSGARGNAGGQYADQIQPQSASCIFTGAGIHARGNAGGQYADQCEGQSSFFTCGRTDKHARGNAGGQYAVRWASASPSNDSEMDETRSISFFNDVEVAGDPGGRWYETYSIGSISLIIAKCGMAIGALLMMAAAKTLKKTIHCPEKKNS